MTASVAAAACLVLQLAAIATQLSAASAAAGQLHAVGGNCSGDSSQQGWRFDPSDDSVKFGSAGCLSEPPHWSTLDELVVVPCETGSSKQNFTSPKQNFTFNATTGLVQHGTGCLALNIKDPDSAMRLAVSRCGGRANPKFESPKELWAAANGAVLRTKDQAQCISAALSRPASWPTQLYDLWTGHDAYTPRGIYRIPSMITTKNGTLIVFAQARVHSTDATPSSVVMRRSFDDGESWEPTRVVLPDFFDATEQVGESLYDPVTDTIFFFEVSTQAAL